MMEQKIQISDFQSPTGPVFGEADEAWTPRYVDILHDYGTTYGFDALDFGTPQQHPRIIASRTRLKALFDGRYMYRRISAETMVRWQTRLQQKSDEIIERYERGLAMFAGVQVNEDLRRSHTITETTSAQDSGTDTTTHQRTTSSTDSRTDRSIDTPQTAINHSANYADSLQESSGTGTDTVSGSDAVAHGMKRDGTRTFTEYDQDAGGLIIPTREAWRAWEDLCLLFVKEFENLFLNVFDY